MKPQRIQRQRTKGWRMPPDTVYVGRGSKYGNPFNDTQLYVLAPVCTRRIGTAMAELMQRKGKPSRESCIDMFIVHLRGQLFADRDFLEPLRGKNLACWCKPDELCHADVLLDMANR